MVESVLKSVVELTRSQPFAGGVIFGTLVCLFVAKFLGYRGLEKLITHLEATNKSLLENVRLKDEQLREKDKRISALHKKLSSKKDNMEKE